MPLCLFNEISRNLPYLKRDCDILSLILFTKLTSIQLSKPALLKKGLRRNYTHTLSIKQLILIICRNLPYLKRDCDSWEDIPYKKTLQKCRNLPYLKRDCDTRTFVIFISFIRRRNLPYLKRDCDHSCGSSQLSSVYQ